MKSKKGQYGKAFKSLSVLQSAPPTCYFHKAQTQPVFSKINVRRKKEKKGKKSRSKSLKCKERLLISFLWYNTAPTHCPHATSKLPCYLSKFHSLENKSLVGNH